MTVYLVEIIKAIGRIFMNPTIYWIFLILIIPSYERLKVEKELFHQNVQPFMKEVKDTWPIALLAGLIISLFTAGIGVTFTYEIIIILSAFIVILSITYHYTFLSASYTLGFTFIVLKFLAYKQPDNPLYSPEFFTSFALLIGWVLLFEAMLYLRTKEHDTFPDVVRSQRGKWLGLHHLRKVTVIPILVPLPKGSIAPLDHFWPYVSIGEETYSFFMFPLVIGFHHIIQSELPFVVAQRLGKFIIGLAVLTLIFSLNSFIFPGLAAIAVVLAIFGRIYIHYKFTQQDREKQPLFIEGNNSLRVLGVIADSPADQLGIKVGEVITKINDTPVQTVADFDHLIKEQKKIVTMEIITHQQKVRQVYNDSYQGNRLELGFLFATAPFQKQIEE